MNYSNYYFDCKKEDFNEVNIDSILNGISDLNFNPKKDAIPNLKKELIEICSDNGFVIDFFIGEGNLKINGLLHKTGLAIQLGNASRFYADMLKMQFLKNNKIIEKMLYFCLTKNSINRSYSSNLISYERFIREKDLFGDIIKLPVLLIGLEHQNI